jgi:hypothetical protein
MMAIIYTGDVSYLANVDKFKHRDYQLLLNSQVGEKIRWFFAKSDEKHI